MVHFYCYQEQMKTRPNSAKENVMCSVDERNQSLHGCILYKEKGDFLDGNDQLWIQWWEFSLLKMSQTIFPEPGSMCGEGKSLEVNNNKCVWCWMLQWFHLGEDMETRSDAVAGSAGGLMCCELTLFQLRVCKDTDSVVFLR
ncbi:unnamed protein product [Lathyrus oleraceus]